MAVAEDLLEIPGQGPVDVLTQREDEDVGIGEFQRCDGGGNRVVEIRRPAESPVKLGADQQQVRVPVKEREDRKKGILEDDRGRAAGRCLRGN